MLRSLLGEKGPWALLRIAKIADYAGRTFPLSIMMLIAVRPKIVLICNSIFDEVVRSCVGLILAFPFALNSPRTVVGNLQAGVRVRGHEVRLPFARLIRLAHDVGNRILKRGLLFPRAYGSGRNQQFGVSLQLIGGAVLEVKEVAGFVKPISRLGDLRLCL